jgi:hypothetical protein
MLTADHPNALWLSDLYRGSEKIIHDPALNEAGRAEGLQQLLAKSNDRMSPDLILHTGGLVFRATLRGEDVDKYRKRRASLVELFPIEVYEILADDRNAIVNSKFRLTRKVDSVVWERIGLGMWRFSDGVAVEHWETPDAHEWDAFIRPTDPAFEGTGAEFWTKEG